MAVLRVSLGGVPHRLGSCFVLVTSSAGAVAVLVCVLALVYSYSATMSKIASVDRVIILSRGADAEAASSLPRESVDLILTAPQVGRTREGTTLASADALTFLRLIDSSSGVDVLTTVRGVTQAFPVMRPEMRIVQGRMFSAGLNEVVVGKILHQRLGLAVGSDVPFPRGDWKVVGVFESGNDSLEAELIGDAESLLSAYGRNTFNSVKVQLTSDAEVQAFNSFLSSNPSLLVTAKREGDYVADVLRPHVKLLGVLAYGIGGIMALGAIFASVNAMFSSVSARSSEIATLRAIGYRGTPLVVALLVEATLFALGGAAVGAVIAAGFFGGNVVSTLTGVSPAPLMYKLTITPDLIAGGMLFGCGIGVIGGAMPAIKLVRSSIVTSLR